ncbi:MAG: hypothetical protein ACM3OH_06810 [Bacillota bacterium]
MTAPVTAPAGSVGAPTGPAGSDAGGVRTQIRDVKNQVVDQAKSTLSQARDSAASSLSDSKGRLADQVTHVADAFRNTTDHLRQQNQPQLAGYADGVARQAERLAGYLRNADFRAMGDDLEQLARRQPALVVGGAFALGLLAARFLKSSERKGREADASDAGYRSVGARAEAYQIPGTGAYEPAGGSDVDR